jgi:multiple sugar transport system permease protein
MEDYGNIRFEMGYAAAISVMLLLIVFGISMFARRLFSDE